MKRALGYALIGLGLLLLALVAVMLSGIVSDMSINGREIHSGQILILAIVLASWGCILARRASAG